MLYVQSAIANTSRLYSQVIGGIRSTLRRQRPVALSETRVPPKSTHESPFPFEQKKAFW
jgi:hypothetical protein